MPVVKIAYDVETVNKMTEILNTISSDTKMYSGLNLVTLIGDLNHILHSGEVINLSRTGENDSVENTSNESTLDSSGYIEETSDEETEK